ncbi:MAG: type I methionyl aminopeptidase [Omnitrophica bacterium RIFCSPHIGHO2_02_FULL_46_11]|nr:MAG: type I methionyl aminopeptidase [Omnitrophica bacterium RIFCSPLOWO2_01_FULL_45_10b]OGW86587.1 MAG: type I methionyl aminopeptidase [Omnitrophica bacterium RIFCSPHIGHO2_02_FULL_46_11]
MISLKSKQEIDIMREAARRLKSVLQELRRSIKTGMATLEIDQKAERLIIAQDAKPAFKGYRGYPACVCTSINEEVVHGIPSKRKLKQGDLLSVDIGLVYKGYVSDSARTWAIGRMSEEARELMEAAQRALYVGMAQMKPGNRIGDISYAVQDFVEGQGFSVIRDFVGHGIGRAMHEDPQVPNFGKPGKGSKLETGLVLAIEPMVAAGSWEVDILEDAWTVVTRDRQWAAHYEDTIALTEKGPENLTGPQSYEAASDQIGII